VTDKAVRNDGFISIGQQCCVTPACRFVCHHLSTITVTAKKKETILCWEESCDSNNTDIN